MLLAPLLLAACSLSASRSGLLDVSENHLALMERDGRTARLVTDEYGAELWHLGGCVIEVSGPRFGKRLYVRQWTVLDAGDGSQPFVGNLRRFGARWMLDDWSTGTTVILADGQLDGLGIHAGKPILVVGFVDGPQEINVISWRALYDLKQVGAAPEE